MFDKLPSDTGVETDGVGLESGVGGCMFVCGGGVAEAPVEQEEDIFETFFGKIVPSYFSVNGCSDSLYQFFSRRNEILAALDDAFIQQHCTPPPWVHGQFTHRPDLVSSIRMATSGYLRS